ncbi:MAG: hypothetical protein EBR93_01195 [Bacteroidetes bacterium]|nr:hypothetical protein [Bacteroidota bacterium]
MIEEADLAIVGSGFGGTLLAILLRQMGYTVALIEKEDHPRFQIGESSTPIADLILRDLSQKYDLPWLKPLSRYGTWKSTYPHLRCGIKRGFSYFFHTQREPFRPNHKRSRELMVAASASNERSDTQWYRADTDQFFLGKAIEADVQYHPYCEIVAANYTEQSGTDQSGWSLTLNSEGEAGHNKIPPRIFRCKHLVDATGSPQFGERFLHTTSDISELQTHSSALFTHLDGVPRWLDILKKSGIETDVYPYDPDLSALHQIVDEGWIWMLRFDNERVSVGLMFDHTGQSGTWNGDAGTYNGDAGTKAEGARTWAGDAGTWAGGAGRIFTKYPALEELFKDGVIAEPPGRWIRTGRLQRLSLPATGPGWVRLPNSVGFIDPMHSTGIAHTLTGVERVAALFDPGLPVAEAAKKRTTYGRNVAEELRLIDRLVAGSYQTRTRPSLFEAWLSWYFVLAIDYEQFRLAGIIPDAFLQADRTELKSLVLNSYDDLQQVLQEKSRSSEQAWIRSVRNQIKPYNKAGLLDPAARHMYKHTAVEGL